MDAAKDIAFMTYLNMPTKKKEFEVKLKMYVYVSKILTHILILHFDIWFEEFITCKIARAKKSLKVASKEEKDIEFTKRAKLAELAGLPTEVKKA